ncbi:MAG: hypothetical protein ABI867_39515 [Kofleriaceae bacterium]
MKIIETIDTAELVTATGGVTQRPDGGGCTDPMRPRPPFGPIGGPLDPSPTFPFPRPTTFNK